MYSCFDRENMRQRALNWVVDQMRRSEWMDPPEEALLDYVPVGARPLYTQLYTEMLEYLERYSEDERRWFMLLRLWPAVVTAPIRRGGGSATEQLLKRLEKWRDWRTAIVMSTCITGLARNSPPRGMILCLS